MRFKFKILLFPLAALLASCNSKFDDFLFSTIPHPQEPEERPYIVKPVEFINPRDGTKLSGELTYPANGKIFNAFVLIAGQSGNPPPNRDNHVTGHNYFLVISHLLTMRGYAVLRYDTRGVGESGGDFLSATDTEYSSDAAAALEWLNNKSGVAISSSGYIGHSQGGIKALVASQWQQPDYVIGLGGVGTQTIAETIIQQNRDINDAKGIEQAETNRIVRELTDIFAIYPQSKDLSEVREKIKQYVLDAGVTDQEHIKSVVDTYGTAWWFNETHQDPKPLIKDHNGPILALFGSKDMLVSSKENESSTRELLQHPKSESYTFSGLNHLFQPAIKGIGPEEYWEIETTIDEKVIDKIDRWVGGVLSENVALTSQ